MRKDSTVIDFGGIVIEDVKMINDSNDKQTHIIEHKTHKDFSPMDGFRPVFTMYFVLMFCVILLAGFLAWFHLKTKAEIMRLMLQNNIQPKDYYGTPADDGKYISPYLKYGIILLAIGIAFLISWVLEQNGVGKLKVPVILLCLGASLLVLNLIRKK